MRNAICLLLLAVLFSGCGKSPRHDPIVGTWEDTKYGFTVVIFTADGRMKVDIDAARMSAYFAPKYPDAIKREEYVQLARKNTLSFTRDWQMTRRRSRNRYTTNFGFRDKKFTLRFEIKGDTLFEYGSHWPNPKKPLVYRRRANPTAPVH